jgi:pimeloyl-ACP methyl ester carboxylesterase
MKKRNKIVLGLSLGAIVPAAVNYLLSKAFEGPVESKYRQYYHSFKYVKIRYIKKGKGEPILLIHSAGPGGSLEEWMKIIEPLSKHYRVYALDLLGHGNSDCPALSYSSYLYAEMINDFVENVIKEKANIVASSESCMFAVAANSLKPHWIKKLILLSPGGMNATAKPYKKATIILGKLMNIPHIGTTLYNIMYSRPFMSYFIRRHCFYDPLNAGFGLINKYYLFAHNKGPAGRYPVSDMLSGHFDLNIYHKLKNIDIPVKIIWGEENEINPVNNIYDTIRENPSIKIAIIERTRMLPQRESPMEFIKECRSFIENQ